MALLSFSRLRAPIVLLLWAALMGYQVYDGYLREGDRSEAVPDLFEPWEAFYRFQSFGKPAGYLADRLYLNSGADGFVRETGLFLSPAAFPPGFIGSATLSLGSNGEVRGFVLRLHSPAGSFTVEATKEGDALRVEVKKSGEQLFPPVSLPPPPAGALRLDLPLFGLEKLSAPSQHELPLPAGTGLATRKIRLEVHPEVAGRRASFILEDGTVQIEMDADGRLISAAGPQGLGLEVSTRAVIGQFIQERDQLTREIGSRRPTPASEGSP